VRSIAYLGLGSNRENRLWFLLEALRMLARTPSIEVLRVSSIYETEPYGLKNQRDFLNAVVHIATDFPPGKLLQCIKFIEKRLGRIDRGHWASREIDIDILLYEDLQLRLPWLTIPHPGLRLRRFVLVPLAEIAPGERVPGAKCSVVQLLRACPDHGRVHLYLKSEQLPVQIEQERQGVFL